MDTTIVGKPFTLNLPTGEKMSFKEGDKVEGVLARHWFVLAHAMEKVVAEAEGKAVEIIAEVEGKKRGRPAAEPKA